jgi:hypothetical protein
MTLQVFGVGLLQKADQLRCQKQETPAATSASVQLPAPADLPSSCIPLKYHSHFSDANSAARRDMNLA